MGKLALIAVLLSATATAAAAATVSVSVPEKTWQILHGEEGRWIKQTLTLDKRGWPKILKTEQLAQKPSQKYTPLFSIQSGELKSDDGSVLWPVTNQWDWNWELKYTEWAKAEFSPSFWSKHGLATDCADALFSARWIFARINGLPMANHLSSGAFFTQNSMQPEWKDLPTAPEWYNDQRFLAAINYLMDHTFTETLWKDSYPVAINANALLVGGYHLHLHDGTGHTQVLYKVGTHKDEAPIITLNSTVPRAVRDLFEFVFLEQSVDQRDSGFLRMRWPVWNGDQVDLVAADKMPQYSLEQYDPNFIHQPRSTFYEEVFYRINPEADYNLIAKKVALQIRDMYRERVKVVEQGYKVCSAKHCDEKTPEYEAWSTPARDGRILDAIGIFQLLLSMVTDGSEIHEVLGTPIVHLRNWDYSVRELIDIFRMGGFSSDPNDPVELRWGVQ